MEPREGAPCSGTISDWWQWDTAGVRTWLHLVHVPRVDFSIGVTTTAGLVFLRETPVTITLLSKCSPSGNYASDGFAFVASLPASIEVRPARWFGLRLIAGPVIDVAVPKGASGFPA